MAMSITLKKICDDFGLTSYGVRHALEQYQKVISEITHGMLSKLTYEADDILRTAQDRWCDTCELMQAKQPRVLTEEDFIDNPLVDENGNVPAWCEHRVFNGIAHDADGWTTISQRLVCAFSRQRFWSARPTNKQIEATPWDELPKEGDEE